MDSTQLQAAADRLSTRLEQLDLDDDERTVLRLLLEAADGSGAPSDAEVEGFESLSLNFSTIVFTYVPQQTNTAPDKRADWAPDRPLE